MPKARGTLLTLGKGKKGNPFRYFLPEKDSAQTAHIDGRNELNPELAFREPGEEGWFCAQKGEEDPLVFMVSHPEGFCRILLTVVTLGRSIGPRGLAGNRQKYLSRKMRLCFNVKTSDDTNMTITCLIFAKNRRKIEQQILVSAGCPNQRSGTTI